MKRQCGFTLIELLVVVGILVIIAGISINTSGAAKFEEAQRLAVRKEMQEIRKAVKRYLADNFILPDDLEKLPSGGRLPADLSFLFFKGSHQSWNGDYNVGWRGPYLESGNIGYVKVNQQYDYFGKITPVENEAALLEFMVFAVPDPFVGYAQKNSQLACDKNLDLSVKSTKCYWEWYHQDRNTAHKTRLGSPYLLLGESLESLRLVSFGPDGRLDLNHELALNKCTSEHEDNPANDDLVLCIN